jgi:two-component system sensor kinase FixL
MEARLAHVARLSTMGEMTAGIAHEVGQPLHAIVNLARATRNILEAEGEPNLGDLREWNAAIAKSAERAADVVRRMRTFARRGEADYSICFVNDIVREAVQLVAFEARRCSAVVRLALPEPSPRVDVGRVQIQQVLVNLLRNAFEAMNESQIDVREVTIRVEPAGESVQVSVVDTGPGLPALNDLGIFEPFVTNKNDGLGLGLPISSSIVEAHDGRLWAEASAAGGAAFHFTLPAFQEESTDGS